MAPHHTGATFRVKTNTRYGLLIAVHTKIAHTKPTQCALVPSTQQKKYIVHLSDTTLSHNDALNVTFNQLQHGLTTIKLLCQLAQLIQQHRGATMAYLSGSRNFLPQIEKLQYSISRVLLLLSELDRSPYHCIQYDLLNHINNDWKTIIIGWQHDQVMPNFEFHSHLIDSLNKLLRLCMMEQLRPLLMGTDNRHESLLDTLFVTFPNSIENLAMLRGLSTNVAVIKACGKDSHTKISFLIKKIEQQNALLFQSINQIIPDIYLIKKYQKPLHKFLLTVKLSILESPEVNVDSDLLFKLSTEIVDAQWMAVSQGIQRVEDLCYRGLIEN